MQPVSISPMDKLRKLYLNKCVQVEKAKLANNNFQYLVLKAEADAIKSEMVNHIT